MTDLKQPYHGRGVLIGATSTNVPVAAYFVSGRSDTSRARTVIRAPDNVRTALEQTLGLGEEVSGHLGMAIQTLPRGEGVDPNDPLLVYNPVLEHLGYHQRGDDRFPMCRLALSNGRQTEAVLKGISTGQSIVDATRDFDHEPDAPNFTPRVNAYLLVPDQGGIQYGFGMLRRGVDGCTQRLAWSGVFAESDVSPGNALSLTTYTGENVESGVPIPAQDALTQFALEGTTLDEVTLELLPRMGHRDFAVGMVVAMFNREHLQFDYNIITFDDTETERQRHIEQVIHDDRR